jgi:hypothetical protein
MQMLAVVHLDGSCLPAWFIPHAIWSFVGKPHPLLFSPAEILIPGLRYQHRLNRQALQLAISRGHLTQQ